MNSLRRWVREFVAIGILTVGVGGGWMLADDDLAWELHESLATNTVASFDTAKQSIFVDVDPQAGGTIVCRYSNTVVDLVTEDGETRPDPDAGVQVEHTWASKANWAHPDDQFPRDSVPGADLHHLFAVRRGINGSRGNHPFGELPADARQLFVTADGTLGDENDGVPSGSFRDADETGKVVFEPRANHKGDVARAMFYMSVRYWMPIPEDMEADLRTWHAEDPADATEIARNERIDAIQGNRNPFVDHEELVDQIRNF